MGITRTGMVLLYPKLIITEYDKFVIAIHPLSKELFKITEIERETGTVTLYAGEYRKKKVDSLERYLFPYVSCDGEVYPISKEWQQNFKMTDVMMLHNFTVEEQDCIQYAVQRDFLRERSFILKGMHIVLKVDDAQYEVLKEVSANNA